MRKILFLTALFLVAGATVSAQESYTYSVTRTRTHTVKINWAPEETDFQRYTISVSPFRLISNGLKFDFEYELPKPGHWLGTSLTVYAASPRKYRYDTWSGDGNDRWSLNSGWDDYHRMWGLGTSAMFKNTFSSRGWYFSTGITLDFFRVGVLEDRYTPYVEDGLTFYEYGRALETKTYIKPTARVNFGKHMAISRRCYFDVYAGIGFTYALYANDGRHMDNYGGSYYRHSYRRFSDLGGFAYRGFIPTGGFRFGVLLWDRNEGL
jgi:hypothetical protein